MAALRSTRFRWALAVAGLAVAATGPRAMADGGGGGGGHEGGARVAVTRIGVAPNGPGRWLLNLHLINEASGSNLTGMEVLGEGTGPQSSVLARNTLFRELGKGDYQADLSGPAGPWSVTLAIREMPGNNITVLPFSRTFGVTAVEGGGGQMAGSAGGMAEMPGMAAKSHGGSGGGGAGPILFGVLLAAVVAGGALWAVKRARTPSMQRSGV
jgi:hypothetical protein